LKYNEYADLNVGFDQPKSKLLGLSVTDPFQDLLVETTMLNRFRSLSIMQETSYYRASVLNSLNKLAEMPDEKWPRPKFVFAHISCPHWPYVFGANGEVIEVLPWYQSDPLVMEKHLNQVKFLNGKVASIVEEILAKSQSPPIIILQGDHGSRYHCSNQYTNAQCMLDDFDILNAYYFPNGSDGLLYKTISPVNSFRVVFDTYFGGNYTLLDDRSFHSDILNSPYKFTDVTTTLMNH
jgi:hypothetical protein